MQYNRHYAAIRAQYGERCAARSGLPLINHIHEGVAVLVAIGSSMRAVEAYCLHPLLQNDDDVQTAMRSDSAFLQCQADPAAVVLAMEYRRVANAYLSHHYQGKDDPIALSCLDEVNDMLIADKVQNRKDFERRHAESHAERARLDAYFRHWLRRLGISESRYWELATMLESVKAPPAILAARPEVGFRSIKQ